MHELTDYAQLDIDQPQPLLRYQSLPGKKDLQPLELHPLLAVVLAHLNSEGATVEQVAATLQTRLGMKQELIHEIVGDAELCFRRLLGRTTTGSWSRSTGRLEQLEASLAANRTELTSREVVFPNDRTHFPLQLQWLVTHYCDRRCIYCYQDVIAGSTSPDSRISIERVLEIVEEGARMGVASIYLTGGEPLLREGIYDVIRRCIELQISPDIFTKHYISETEADQLAGTGLRSISLSIDSLDPEVAAKVTGCAGFADEMTAVVERLVKRDIAVRTSTVFTSANAETIPMTVERLADLGVKEACIDTWGRTPNSGLHYLMPAREVSDRICEWADQFNSRSEATMNARVVHSVRDREALVNLKQDRIYCHNGLTALLFFPDGKVHRCDKDLPGDWVVGDLTTQSVQEVWQSRKMLDSLQPDRELYKGSLCYDCDYFLWCHRQGRCFYDALVAGGSLYGPHEGCPFFVKQKAAAQKAQATNECTAC